MKFKSAIVTQASGSLGGITFGHNQGGLYMRARSIPVNPNTTFQQQVKAAVTSLVTAWSSVLTAVQRAAWDLYGANTPTTDALGNPIFLSGQNWFVACNVPRLQVNSKLAAGLIQVNAAPTIFDRGDFTTPTPTAGEAAGVSVAYDDTDAWAAAADNVLLIYQGRPRNPGRNYFRGPYRLVGFVEGAVVPPTPPEVIAAATLTTQGFTITELQACTWAFAVSRVDGRLSTRRDVSTIVAA